MIGRGCTWKLGWFWDALYVRERGIWFFGGQK